MAGNRGAVIHDRDEQARSWSVRNVCDRGWGAGGKRKTGMTAGDAGMRRALLAIGVNMHGISQQPRAQRETQQPRIAALVSARCPEDGGRMHGVGSHAAGHVLRLHGERNMPQVRAVRQATDRLGRYPHRNSRAMMNAKPHVTRSPDELSG
jgi:hypothetical protein